MIAAPLMTDGVTTVAAADVDPFFAPRLFPVSIDCAPLKLRFAASEVLGEAVTIDVRIDFDKNDYAIINSPAWVKQPFSIIPNGDFVGYKCTITVPAFFGTTGTPPDPGSVVMPRYDLIPEVSLVKEPGGFGNIFFRYEQDGGVLHNFVGDIDDGKPPYVIPAGAVSSSITDVSYAFMIRDNGCSPILPSIPNNVKVIQAIKIEGDFIVDESICFKTGVVNSSGGGFAKQILMGSGAHIIVKPGVTLSITGVPISSCDILAQGITVEPGGKLILTGSTIADCRWAVEAQDRSSVSINGNNFVNNYIGFKATGTLSFAGPFPFAGNTFTSTQLKPKFAGMPENFRDIGLAGIVLNDCRDFNSWGGNTFSSLANGIIATNSNCNLDRLSMSSIGSTSALYNPRGYGIIFKGGNTAFLNLSKGGAGCGFSNIGADAIYVEKGAGTIENCNISNFGGSGIRWTTSQLRDKVIQGNTITQGTPKGVGINLSFCEPTPFQSYAFGSVARNTVSNIPFGIRSVEPSASSTELGWNFANNTVLTASTTFPSNTQGISYNLGQNGWLTDNTVTTTGGGSRNLILTRTTKPVVNINHLFCDGDISTVAIDLISNRGGQLECNEQNSQTTGVRVQNENGGMQIKGSNDLIGHNIGIEYGSAAIPTGATGIQNHNGNVFRNSSLGIGAKHWDPIVAIKDRYLVDQKEADLLLDPTRARTHMPASFSPDFWFRDLATPNLSYYCQTPPPGEPCEYEWTKTVVDNEWTPTLYPQSQVWIANYRVLVDLLEPNDASDCESYYANYVQNNQNTVRYQLAEIKVLRDQLFMLSATQTAELQAKTAAMYAGSADVANTQKQIYGGVDGLVSLLNTQSLTYRGQIDALEVMQSGLQDARRGKAAQIQFLNNAIAIESVIENNHKLINHIALSLLIEQREANGDELDQLKQIAKQCPLTGGDAVFEARGMLGDLIEIDDDLLCAPELNRQQQSKPIDLQVSALQPNPASGFIRLHKQTGKNYQITNQYGVVVAQGVLNSEYVETAAYASGIYFITISDTKSRPVTHRFVIIKE
jgi:hypothetical protein